MQLGCVQTGWEPQREAVVASMVCALWLIRYAQCIFGKRCGFGATDDVGVKCGAGRHFGFIGVWVGSAAPPRR
mgnify:CR=1 FL=1